MTKGMTIAKVGGNGIAVETDPNGCFEADCPRGVAGVVEDEVSVRDVVKMHHRVVGWCVPCHHHQSAVDKSRLANRPLDHIPHHFLQRL